MITLNKIQKQLNKRIEENKEFFNSIDFVIGMSRGGLIPAVLLSTKINKPLVTIYIDKQDKIYFDRLEWLKNKSILVVDDIVRSGHTLQLVKEYLTKNIDFKTINFFTLYSVKGMKKHSIEVISKELKKDIIFPWDYDRMN
jgi:hypoxanthine phosphoribosyltransferase